MRISKRLKIAALAPILTTTVIGLALISCNKSIENIRGQASLVRQIMNDMKELNNLAYSYLIYPEERPKQQFLLQHASITTMITTMRLTSIAPQQLNDIRRDSENIKATFFTLVLNTELINSAEPASLFSEVNERLAGQLLIQLNDILSDTLSLELQLDKELASTQNRINWFIFFIISTTTAAMTIILLRMLNTINASLTTIYHGTELIGSGNLEHRIDLATDDEFGELSRAVDSMATKLQVSNSELYLEVAERKQTQLQLEEINEMLKQRTGEAEQASRSKSSFLSTVAHEFRTPLSLLVSSTDILNCYGEKLGKDQLSAQNAHIRSAALQISKLIDSVLSFNQLEAARYMYTPLLLDIERLCRVIADEVNTVWGAGHNFQLMISASCGSALLDEILFRRVLENLLTNAFRYTPAGGTVSLQITRQNKLLSLVITDTGIGIPAEDQERIFGAFYRGSNIANRRGLGLGLSIVHEALLKMEGTIMLTSSIGAGTTMQVEIPVSDQTIPKEHECTQS